MLHADSRTEENPLNRLPSFVSRVVLLRNVPVLVLTMLIVVSLIGLGVMTYQTASLTGSYTDVEDNVFLDIVSIRDTNGTLSSYYYDSIDDYGSGDFNVTLPVSFYDRRPLEINGTIVKVRIECQFHAEIPGEHEELLDLVWAEDLVVTAGGASLAKSNPPFEFVVSSGFGASHTTIMEMALNTTLLQSLNDTAIDVAYECMMQTDCEGYYAVNYVFSMRVDLWNRRLMAGVSVVPGITLLALGVMSAGLLVLEFNQLWSQSHAKSGLSDT